MARKSKKERIEWLVTLWDYHNGHLPKEELEDVESKLAQDPDSQTDSERVFNIINQLRQEGRWETHPDFPKQMVSRLIEKDSTRKSVALAVGLVIAIIVVLLWIAAQKGEASFPFRNLPEWKAAPGVVFSEDEFEDYFYDLDSPSLELKRTDTLPGNIPLSGPDSFRRKPDSEKPAFD